MVPGTEAKLKSVHLLSNPFLPAVTGVRRTRNFDLWLWDSHGEMWWPERAAEPRMQQERKDCWAGDKPMNTVLESTPVWGQELVHFKGRHVTLSDSASTAVHINWYKSIWVGSAMELIEKCTFSGFKICVHYIGCHPDILSSVVPFSSGV